jgi:E3 ubiquitin-protein ligase SHPRH
MGCASLVGTPEMKREALRRFGALEHSEPADSSEAAGSEQAVAGAAARQPASEAAPSAIASEAAASEVDSEGANKAAARGGGTGGGTGGGIATTCDTLMVQSSQVTSSASGSCDALMVPLFGGASGAGGSGAAGLNLQVASVAVLLEPCLQPGIEAQAVGRICRLGQQRPTRCVRLVVGRHGSYSAGPLHAIRALFSLWRGHCVCRTGQRLDRAEHLAVAEPSAGAGSELGVGQRAAQLE